LANRVTRAKPDTARAKAVLQRQTIALLLEMLLYQAQHPDHRVGAEGGKAKTI
jgi:hypothetical protein